MRYSILDEVTIPASSLPDYVGWTLNGAMRADGILAWGPLESAAREGDIVYIVHPVTVRTRCGSETVQESARVYVLEPDGRPHVVTVSRSRAVDDDTTAGMTTPDVETYRADEYGDGAHDRALVARFAPDGTPYTRARVEAAASAALGRNAVALQRAGAYVYCAAAIPAGMTHA